MMNKKRLSGLNNVDEEIMNIQILDVVQKEKLQTNILCMSEVQTYVGLNGHKTNTC